MTPKLRIVAPGLATTVQDMGRIGYQRLGVPVSGALDREALMLANVVVGNAPETAALECLYQGPVIEIQDAAARFAIAGAGASLEVTPEPGAAPLAIPAATSVTVAPGSRVKVLLSGPGIAAVLAIEGGVAVPAVLGSRSTYLRSAIGGFHGRALHTGDDLTVAAAASGTGERSLPDITLAPPAVARVVLGPQDDAFAPDVIAQFLATDYRVGTTSDRMGLRLEGPALTHRTSPDIVSDATAWGAIQVPGDGRPIVLLADRQTTGGYTKIATVITADLPALSRAGPGHVVRFTAVSIEEATEAARARAAEIATWASRLETVRPPLDTERLLSLNLIDGFPDARA